METTNTETNSHVDGDGRLVEEVTVTQVKTVVYTRDECVENIAQIDYQIQRIQENKSTWQARLDAIDNPQ